MNHSRLPHVLKIFALLAITFLFVSIPVRAAPPGPGAPAISIEKNGWTKKGQLVLGVRIAASSAPLELGRLVMEKGKSPQVTPYNMAGSQLTDVYSGQVVPTLQTLPYQPFFGAMAGYVLLNPKDSIRLGVAFVHPPDPPMGKDGKPLDYKFKLQIPGQDTPINFTIPYVAFDPAKAGAGK